MLGRFRKLSYYSSAVNDDGVFPNGDDISVSDDSILASDGNSLLGNDCNLCNGRAS